MKKQEGTLPQYETFPKYAAYAKYAKSSTFGAISLAIEAVTQKSTAAGHSAR